MHFAQPFPLLLKRPLLLGVLLSGMAATPAVWAEDVPAKAPPRKVYKDEDPGCAEVRAILKQFIVAEPAKADLTLIRFMRAHQGCACSLAKAGLSALPKKENGKPNTPMLAAMLRAAVDEIYRALPGCKGEVKAIVLTAINALRTGDNIDPADFSQLKALIRGKRDSADSKIVFEPERDSKSVIEPEHDPKEVIDPKIVFAPLRDDDLADTLDGIDLADLRELLAGVGGLILNYEPSLLHPIMGSIGYSTGGTGVGTGTGGNGGSGNTGGGTGGDNPGDGGGGPVINPNSF